MTRYRIYDIARDEDNVPIVGASVSLRRLSDNSEIDSTSTDASGGFGFTEAEVGYPGPVKVRVTGLDGVTRERTGKSTGQTGTYFHSDLMRAFSVMNNGVVLGYDNELAVTADGIGRDVSVANGLFFIQGHPLYFPDAQTIPIVANGSGSARIDLIVINFTMPGEGEEGRASIIAIPGTPSGSPAPPAPSQGATLWQEPLAQVAVANGASSIAMGNVTDRRVWSTGPLTDGSVETVHLDDGAVTNAKLAPAIDAVKLADGSVTNTEFQYINTLTSNAQTQIDTKAATAHTHLLAAGATDVTASAVELNTLDGVAPTLTAAELNHIDGVTSPIQPQIDGKAATVHTHAGSAITSGTVAYAYLPTGTAANTVAIGNHTHSGVYANTSHSHAGADITTGTVAIGRLPTGTTSSTVSLGDHTHSLYASNGSVVAKLDHTSPIGGHSINWIDEDLVIDASTQSGGPFEFLGDVRFGSAITVGFVKPSVSPPTLTIGSAAGTGGAAAVSFPRGGSITAGQIRIVCGTTSLAAGTLVTFNFPVAKSNTNYLVLFGETSAAAAAVSLNVSTKTVNGFPIVCANVPTSGMQIDIDYLIVDVPNA